MLCSVVLMLVGEVECWRCYEPTMLANAWGFVIQPSPLAGLRSSSLPSGFTGLDLQDWTWASHVDGVQIYGDQHQEIYSRNEYSFVLYLLNFANCSSRSGTGRRVERCKGRLRALYEWANETYICLYFILTYISLKFAVCYSRSMSCHVTH